MQKLKYPMPFCEWIKLYQEGRLPKVKKTPKVKLSEKDKREVERQILNILNKNP